MPHKYLKVALTLFGFLFFGLIIFITQGKSLFWNAIAMCGLMIYFWIFEVIPIYITALFPLVLAAPLGLLTVNGRVDSSILAKSYGNNMIFVFLGGFILALALEKWQIHMQMARFILRIVGQSKSRIVLGFLLSTGFLSMWVSNTATALMMLPMAVAVVQSLPEEEQQSRFSIFLLLSIAYGSNIGGVGTLIGSPPNLQMAGILSNQFGVEVDFGQWFVVGFPLCALMLGACYLFFYIALGKERHNLVSSFSVHLEPWTKNQYKVLAVFMVFVLLWSFKDVFALVGIHYTDESVAVFGSFLLFVIPADKHQKLLHWEDTNKLPWGVLLLFGGGLAMADALARGGIMIWLSELFLGVNNWPFYLILFVFTFGAIFISEVISNLALTAILVPIVGVFANQYGYSIVQLGFAVTFGASLAFMLPIGTPPNAIVFSTGKITFNQMAKLGFALNLISLILIFLMCYLFL